MVPAHIGGKSVRFVLAALVGAWAVALGLTQPARAADIDKIDVPSLKEIPADAAFYTTMLRNREQIDIIAKSKAWAKLTALPGVQTLWQQLMVKVKEDGGPLQKYEEFVKAPENKQLVDMLVDMVSTEVFFYGGANSSNGAQLAMELVSALRFGPTLIQLTGNPKNLSQQEMMAASVFGVLSKSIDLIQTPEFVIGFKLSKTGPADDQLKRLEGLLGMLEQIEPKLKGRVKRVKAAGGSFLTIDLDGKLVPFQDFMAPLKDFEDKPGDYDAVIKKLSGLKATIGLGVRNGYLLLSLGSSLAHLDSLGSKGTRLIDTTEFKPLAKYADQRLTSVTYLSKTMHAKLAPSKRDLEGYLQLANAWLPKADLTADQKARLKKDLAEVVKELQAYIPDAGAVLSFGFLTARGMESYAYDWSQNLVTDGSKPLTLLNHVGGDPVLAVVTRGKSQPDAYPKMVKLLTLVYGWGEEVLLPKATPEQKQQYAQVKKIFMPLLKKVDDVTGKQLVPALADGQVGFVIDAKLSSKQWVKFPLVPVAAKPLPIPEPALVFGVSDPDKLVKAFTDYRSIANDLLTQLRKLDEKVPDFQIPAPKMSKVKGGTMYSYPLPDVWNIDEKLLPNGGVGETVAALTLSKEHTERLLTSTPLKVDGGPLADPKRKLSYASYINWAGMVDALPPWVDFGIELATTFNPGQEINKEDILKQAGTVFEVLKVFRTTMTASYAEDGAQVTHSETRVQDLK
jgi:hypothetical protein